jgi:predicted short-subunit dehydrogenase-like oxidoreductase (DUF2520 family)
MRTTDFALIGPGRLGLRLADRLRQRGWSWVAVRGRRHLPSALCAMVPSATVCDTWHAPATWAAPRVIFVTVPDDAISEVATRLASALEMDSSIVLHTSGLHDAGALAPCRAAGARVGSWHPLQSFPPIAAGTVQWDGVWCAVEGDLEAVEQGTSVASALGLNPWRIAATDKPRYHAAASVAANLTHILVAEAARVMSGCGLPQGDGEHPLWPLVEASLRGALEGPGLDRLTGALARADIATITRHLAVLDEPLREAYQALSKVVTQATVSTEER